MNDSQQISSARVSDARRVAWRQVVAILFAAIGLGLVYNVASPLGVRAPQPGLPAQITPLSPRSAVSTTAPAVSTDTTKMPSPPSNATTQVSASTLRWTEVAPLLASGQIVLLDARAKAAYDIEHIPGALSLPAESAPEEFITFALKHPKDTAIVVYCNGENCDLSHELGEKLRNDLGYPNVREMPGGIVEYRLAESKRTR